MEPETEQVRHEAAGLINDARALVVSDAETYKAAGEFQHRLRGGIKRIEEFFSPMKSAAHAAWKAVTKREGEVLDPVRVAYDDLGRRAGDWFLADRRRREDEERKAQEIRLKAEREAAEKQRKLEEAARKKHLPPPPPQPPPPPPPPVQAAPKLEGAQARTMWDFEIVDVAKIPREYMVPDAAKIRGVVKALKGATKIGGVRVYETASVSGRSA